MKIALLPGEFVTMLFISIVFPDGLKLDRFVLWIIEIGSSRNMGNDFMYFRTFILNF